MRKTPLRKVSQKQAALNRQYLKLRKEYLPEGTFCHVPSCSNLATEIHHKARRGKNLLDTSTWMGICRTHHDYLHQNPKWARENGYLV